MPRRLAACPICGELLEHRVACTVSRAANAQANIRQAYRERDKLIRECRRRGVSQQAIAEAIGVSKGLVQLAEKG